MSARPIAARASAPAKAILFGEHAVNRGQGALAVSVGLRATCRLTIAPHGDSIRLAGARRAGETTRAAVLAQGRAIDGYRERGDYAAIQALARDDFFAPAKYVLAALGEALPAALDIAFASEIPPSAGLGSGGATFVALTAALGRALGPAAVAAAGAGWAQRGDIVAHGGVASGLDTQTSAHGGVIRYAVGEPTRPVACAAGLRLVIGNTGVVAATSAVNGRVREWLAAEPSRLHYFREIGLLARLGEGALRAGDWGELGQLINLNQLLLARIGVSCPELEALIEAALAAGALGAKLSGSGGGGIMIALVTDETAEAVARAIRAAGGEAFAPPIAVPGARAEPDDGDVHSGD